MGKKITGDVVVHVRLKPVHRETLEYFRQNFKLGYAQGIKMILEMVQGARFYTCPQCQNTYLQSPEAPYCPKCRVKIIPTKIEEGEPPAGGK